MELKSCAVGWLMIFQFDVWFLYPESKWTAVNLNACVYVHVI